MRMMTHESAKVATTSLVGSSVNRCSCEWSCENVGGSARMRDRLRSRMAGMMTHKCSTSPSTANLAHASRGEGGNSEMFRVLRGFPTPF